MILRYDQLYPIIVTGLYFIVFRTLHWLSLMYYALSSKSKNKSLDCIRQFNRIIFNRHPDWWVAT